ncbi:MAG: J domain-containing protein [Synergistaceae bacterium]|nr:J domain-containing protein [Synergistaceae bacterium]
MERYNALLGVHPAASADEIEEAYQSKRREIAPERFTQGSEEHQRALAAMQELDRAYNEALMASFAPIRAFSAAPPKTPQPHPVSPVEEVGIPPESLAFVRSSYVPPPRPAARDLKGLVEEAPISFSDAQLLNMDVGALRESASLGEEEPGVLTFGIQDPLARFYVRAYLGFAFFDLVMTLLLGAVWRGMSGRYVAFVSEAMPNLSLVQALVENRPSLLMSIVTPFFSTLYLFFCSLPMPVVTRFFVMGQPTENGTARWMLTFASIMAAYAIYALTGFLFQLLPPAWAGSSASLFFVAPALCLVTIRYQGF